MKSNEIGWLKFSAKRFWGIADSMIDRGLDRNWFTPEDSENIREYQNTAILLEKMATGEFIFTFKKF